MQIHELNTFAGTPGAGNFLAIDNGSDTGKISGEALLKGPNDRIDNLVANVLPDTVETIATDSSGIMGTITLSKSVNSFNFLDFYFKSVRGVHLGGIRIPVSHLPATITVPFVEPGDKELYEQEFSISASGTSFTVQGRLWEWAGRADDSAFVNSGAFIALLVRVDGINISSNTNAELADLRVAHNGITYASARAAREADYDVLDNGILTNKSSILRIASPQILNIFESGTLNAGDGTDSGNLARIRTKTYIDSEILRIIAASGYEFLVYAYSNDNYLGCWQTDNTFGTTSNVQYVKDFTFKENYDYRIVLRNEAGTTMDETTDYVKVTFYYPADVTLTQKNKAADAKAVGDKFIDFEERYSVELNGSNLFESGGLYASTGEEFSSTERIRLKKQENFFYKTIAGEGYSFIIFAFDNGTYIGTWTGTTFVIGATLYFKEFEPDMSNNYDYRIVVKKDAGGDIDPSEGVNISFFATTDTTLTKKRKAADAKITGEQISQAKEMTQDVANGFGGVIRQEEYEAFSITDINKLTPNAAINGSGAEVYAYNSYCTSEYIPITWKELAKLTYSLVSPPTSYYGFIAFYDKNKTFISRAGGLRQTDLTAAAPENTAYCRFSLTYVGLGNVASLKAAVIWDFTHVGGLADGSPITKWYVLGDSISAGYYSMTESMAEAAGVTMTYISPVTTDQGEVTGSVWDATLAHNYWGYINKWYLGRDQVGKAYPGQGYFRIASNDQNGVYVVDNNDFSDAGLITVAWGFNDWHYNQPRGNHNLIDSNIPIPPDNFDTSLITTVNHAIWYCLGRLIKKAPNAKILVQTPMNGWAYGGDFSTKWGIEYAMSQSGMLKDIHDDIIYWCDYYGLEYLDMTFNNSIVNLVNIKDTIIDGSHPSDLAHQQLARSIWTKVGY